MVMADPGKSGNVLYLKNKSLQCKNLHDYLKTLAKEILERLYNHPTTCLAVYRYVLSRTVNSFIFHYHTGDLN